MTDGANRWRSRLDTALTVAAIAGTVLALAVLLTLAWWVRSLSTASPPEAALQSVPDRALRPAAAPPRSAARPPQHAPAPVQQAAVAVTPIPIAAPTAPRPTRGANDDAAKNRALGAALSRLGNDPELRHKLGLDGIDVPP